MCFLLERYCFSSVVAVAFAVVTLYLLFQFPADRPPSFHTFFATFFVVSECCFIHSTIEVKRAVSLDALTYSLDGKVKCAFYFSDCFTLNSSLPPKGGGQVATLLLFGVLPLALVSVLCCY